MNLPCDANTPNAPIFQVLVGRAPDLAPLALGYISQISVSPQMCVYHGQFGFGDPVTDIILKNVSAKTITLGGPHSVTITTHEYYIPTAPSFEQYRRSESTFIKGTIVKNKTSSYLTLLKLCRFLQLHFHIFF